MLRSLQAALLLLVAFTALTLGAAAWAQSAPIAPPIHVRVLPHVEVSGTEFTLGEVAELDGSDLASVRRLAGVSLGRSPLPGRTLRLNASYVRARLSMAFNPDMLELDVPPGAEIVRASQVVSGGEIGERVLAFAAEQGRVPEGDLEQALTVPLPDAMLPRGEVTWEIEPLGRHLGAGGARSFRVVAKVRDEEVWRSIARVNQHVYRKVLVAARAVRRNQLIRPSDVVLERKSISGVNEDAFLTRTAEVVGSRAKRPIGRGEWIHKGLVNAVAVVPEGGPVMLVYQTSEVRFTSPGVALVPAQVGEFIPVRNLASGKIVYGVVQPNETVKVN